MKAYTVFISLFCALALFSCSPKGSKESESSASSPASSATEKGSSTTKGGSKGSAAAEGGAKSRSKGNAKSGRAKGSASAKLRAFPLPGIPTLLSAPEERRDYLLTHYWDAFFAPAIQAAEAQGSTGAASHSSTGEEPASAKASPQGGTIADQSAAGGLNASGLRAGASVPFLTDSTTVLGVADAELSQSFANFNSLLLQIPVSQAQSHIRSLFSKIEATRDGLIYLRMTELVSHYLYDPNSPLRSEDLFLPFVEAMYHSPMTSEDRRPGYRFEMEMCSLNPYGSTAPDFNFLDPRERPGHLHGIKADFIMLFFSNPGCHACKEIIDQIATRPYIDPMIASGRLAILNIYIDAEVDKWREHLPDYPANWINARDHKQIIQSDQLYYVRAIPSLYLLDSQKRVIAKDIPVERALTFLDNINQYQYAN